MEVKKKISTIRFGGYDTEWETKKLGEIGTTYTGLSGKTKDDFGKGDGRFVPYMNVFTNPLTSSKQLEKVGIDEKQNEVKKGDVFFTTSSETPGEVGMSSVWLHDIKNVYLNSFCFAYRPTINIESYYLAYLLRSSEIRKQFSFLAQGISRYNISKGKAMEISIPLPSNSEQSKIGNYFKELDELIRLQEQKHEKFLNLKKAMLDKMFPKDGADVPEIRFKGFTDKWDSALVFEHIKKIIDFRGRTPLKLGLNWSSNGYLALSALNVKQGYIDKSIDANYGDDNLYNKWMVGNELHKGQVLFTTEAPMGNVARIPDDCKYILSQRTIAFTVDEQHLLESYLFVSLSHPSFYKKLEAICSGGTAKGVSQKTLGNLFIHIPCLQEQEQIGAYFEKLDKLIVQSQEQITKYKNIKQALLQKMFV